MKKIQIPKSAFNGLKIIGNLKEDQLVKITEYFDTMNSDPKLSSFIEFLNSQNIGNPDDLVSTLLSFSKLLNNQDSGYEEITERLAISYNELSNANLAHSKLIKLQNNLLQIFNHSANLKMTMKASEVVNESENLFMHSRVMTDIRIVFDEDVAKQERNAVVIHSLIIDYANSIREQEKINIAVDIDDLKKLKSDIERAILKNSIIINEYNNSLNFLNFNKDE